MHKAKIFLVGADSGELVPMEETGHAPESLQRRVNEGAKEYRR